MDNIIAKKSLGQNFLNSDGAIKEMVTSAQVTNSDTVLEVGPGKGVLTKALLATGAKVITIEKDDRLISPLRKKFSKEIESGQLNLIHGDILEYKLKDCGLDTKEYKVIANIPYYITGHFFRKLFGEEKQPNTIVTIVQKEVAERIVAKDEKESVLSLSVKVYGTPKYVKTVHRGSFFPVPNVDSAILAIFNISRKNFSNIKEDFFFEVVKTGFSHKRKKLFGNLKPLIGEEKLKEAFVKINQSQDLRAEDLKLDDWLLLIEKIKNF